MPNPTINDVRQFLTRKGVKVQGFDRPKELDSATATVSVWLPMRLKNPLNVSEHWRVRSKRAKMQRTTAFYRLAGIAKPTPPVVVTITRMYSGRCQPMDDDGLSAACKNLRDGVADSYNSDDSKKSGLRFVCQQERAADNLVHIVIEPEHQ